MVVTEGSVLKAKVHGAKLMDYERIEAPLRQADGGYWVEDKGKDWIVLEVALSVRRAASTRRGSKTAHLPRPG
jgi:hypothetical protein